MADESYSFAQARVRLEEIVSQVRKKDVSLEKSLDLLEEGVRLANQCTELIDHADWDAAAGVAESEASVAEAGEAASPQPDDSAAADPIETDATEEREGEAE